MGVEVEGTLTPKQAIFVAEFLISRNATRAAIAAGYSEKTAEAAGSRLLRNVKVSAVLAERNARLEQKLDVTAERVIRELAKLSFYDPRDLFDEQGNLLPVHRLDEVTRAAIAALDVETKEHKGARSILKKIKLADKGQNLERLGRYLKLFTDRVEHHGKLTLERLVCETQDPAGEDDEEGEED